MRLATSQRLLGFAIFALLAAALVAVFVKGPGEEQVTIGGPTTSPTPTPTETFTFPGPIPTDSETPLFPTESGTPAGPTIMPGDELPRTGGGSILWPAAMTLATAAAAGLLMRRAAGRPDRSERF